MQSAPTLGTHLVFVWPGDCLSKSVSDPDVKGELRARWVMTVIMVLLTFAIFLLIDYVRGQKQLAKQPVLQTANRESAARVVPAVVAGFQVPENLRYHAGHTWALSESHELVRVGIDDFASKLVGQDGQHRAAAARTLGSPRSEDLDHLPRRQVGGHGLADRGHGNRHQRSSHQQSGTGAQRSLRRRLARDRAGSRLEDQLPQPDGRHAGAAVDRILRSQAA